MRPMTTLPKETPKVIIIIRPNVVRCFNGDFTGTVNRK
jgi:hypothetical protein